MRRLHVLAQADLYIFVAFQAINLLCGLLAPRHGRGLLHGLSLASTCVPIWTAAALSRMMCMCMPTFVAAVDIYLQLRCRARASRVLHQCPGGEGERSGLNS